MTKIGVEFPMSVSKCSECSLFVKFSPVDYSAGSTACECVKGVLHRVQKVPMSSNVIYTAIIQKAYGIEGKFLLEQKKIEIHVPGASSESSWKVHTIKNSAWISKTFAQK